jgi:hypothetical protein
MLTTTMKSFRLSKMTGIHQTVQGVLSSTPMSIANIAASVAMSPDDAEKRLSALVDENLASRTVGSRITATYTVL